MLPSPPGLSGWDIKGHALREHDTQCNSAAGWCVLHRFGQPCSIMAQRYITHQILATKASNRLVGVIVVSWKCQPISATCPSWLGDHTIFHSPTFIWTKQALVVNIRKHEYNWCRSWLEQIYYEMAGAFKRLVFTYQVSFILCLKSGKFCTHLKLHMNVLRRQFPWHALHLQHALRLTHPVLPILY